MNIKEAFEKQLGEKHEPRTTPLKGKSAISGKPYSETNPEFLLFFMEEKVVTPEDDRSGVLQMPEVELALLTIGVEELDELCNLYELVAYHTFRSDRIPTLVKKK